MTEKSLLNFCSPMDVQEEGQLCSFAIVSRYTTMATNPYEDYLVSGSAELGSDCVLGPSECQ